MMNHGQSNKQPKKSRRPRNSPSIIITNWGGTPEPEKEGGNGQKVEKEKKEKENGDTTLHRSYQRGGRRKVFRTERSREIGRSC